MLVAIVNHMCTPAAIALKQAFSANVETCLIDSGSLLTEAERMQIDRCLPNVYYSGLLNAVVEHAAGRPDDEPVWLWCSDVSVCDAAQAVLLATRAFTDPLIGVYAPSAWFSGHPQMWNKRTTGLRRVMFVEGFCFAARLGLLRALCPVDTALNELGWGLDIQLGFLANSFGRHVVVDDCIEVKHPRKTAYCTEAARVQRARWVASLPHAAQRFHRIAKLGLAKRRPFVGWLSGRQWSCSRTNSLAATH